MIEGFDASGWTGDIDFYAAKAYGKQYGIYRVGRGKPDGATDQYGVDKLWRQNKIGSINAGLKTGGYWRFFPDVDMGTQVNRFVSALGQLNGMLDPWVDLEDTGGLSPTALTDWANQCLALVSAKTGRRAVLYTGKNFYDNQLEYWRLTQYKIAIAWQTSGKWREYGAHFWQYSLDIPVPWARGRVDLQKYAFDDLDHETFANELLYKFDEDGLLHGPLVYSDMLLPEAANQGTQGNHVFIVHTMVGSLVGTDSYFRQGSVDLESSMGIGGKYDGTLDGAIYQWMYLDDRADANYEANAYAFSVETSDGSNAQNPNRWLERWSPLQAESLAQSAAAWCLVTGRPARLVNRSHSSVHGIGHHRIGTVPYPHPGDDYWSPPSQGPRACPGQTRIDQLTFEVIPRVQEILASLSSTPPPNPPDEDDMALDDVVGTVDGQEITVRNALLAAFKGNQNILEVAAKIDALPHQWKIDIVHKIDELYTLTLMKGGQPTWNAVNESHKTWCQISSMDWGEVY